jgi:hypothetical protein
MKTPKPFEQNGSRYGTGSNGERVCTGAMMGRSDCLPMDRAESVKLRLERVRPCDGGDYDKGGAYWGDIYSRPLYCAYNDTVTGYIRARTRELAKAVVLGNLPNARFYR